MFNQILIKRFSKPILFGPCGVFILCNFLTAYYITTSGVYSGDFAGIPSVHSHLEVWFYACVASTPYLILYYIILRTAPVNLKPIRLPKLFVLFGFIALILSLVLTLNFGVGMMAQEIYSVPTVLKPLFVLINRINPIVLSGILILSPYIKYRSALLITGLLLLITIFRGSLMYVPVILLLLFYRVCIFEKYSSKFKKNSKLSISLLYIILLAFVMYFAAELYEIRNSIRGLETQQLPTYEFIFSKLIGRFSNLPALLMFESRYDLFNQRIDELQSFSYLTDCFKYIWGGFIKTPVMNHYDYFTSILDPNAYGFYAMQTGVLPAMGLSMMKSPIIMILDVFITYLFIYYTVRLSTFFLGYSGKYLTMSLMIFAILSGAPNQFSAPVFHLLIIVIVFFVIKYISTPYARKS